MVAIKIAGSHVAVEDVTVQSAVSVQIVALHAACLALS